jgi:rhodanese-related sulfurtransferase
MSVVLSCCALGVWVILVWCSLWVSEQPRPSSARQEDPKGHLEYIPISPPLLGEWSVGGEHLMIIDLRPSTDAGADFDSIPGSLRIPPEQLRSYFCYMPPDTRLVLYDKDTVTRLDSKAESALLMTGIHAVYILIGGICAWHTCVTHKRGSMELLPR